MDFLSHGQYYYYYFTYITVLTNYDNNFLKKTWYIHVRVNLSNSISLMLTIFSPFLFDDERAHVSNDNWTLFVNI